METLLSSLALLADDDPKYDLRGIIPGDLTLLSQATGMRQDKVGASLRRWEALGVLVRLRLGLRPACNLFTVSLSKFGVSAIPLYRNYCNQSFYMSIEEQSSNDCIADTPNLDWPPRLARYQDRAEERARLTRRRNPMAIAWTMALDDILKDVAEVFEFDLDIPHLSFLSPTDIRACDLRVKIADKLSGRLAEGVSLRVLYERVKRVIVDGEELESSYNGTRYDRFVIDPDQSEQAALCAIWGRYTIWHDEDDAEGDADSDMTSRLEATVKDAHDNT